MRYAATFVLFVCLLAVGYALTPLWVAMDVRRAVMSGDVATLEARVDWSSVRLSLKESLADIERAKDVERTVRGLPRPSLWQRIKAAASPVRFADQIIDRYVNPQGVASLAAAKGNLGTLLRGAGAAAPAALSEQPEHTLPVMERAQRFWNRLKRVTVLSPTAVEIEMADKRVPERSYVGTLAFVDLRWRVISARIVGAGF